MFGGLVFSTVLTKREGRTLGIRKIGELEGVKEGGSVAVNGACLSVVEVREREVLFWVSPETSSRTNLFALPLGSKLNCELPLRVGDRIEGHVLLGHVDEVGEILDVREWGKAVEVEVRVRNRKFLVEKGSVGLDGMSLTVNTLTPMGFRVMLIPETLKRSNASAWYVGYPVNVEYDYLLKGVVRAYEIGER